jgi:hypothetical protein
VLLQSVDDYVASSGVDWKSFTSIYQKNLPALISLVQAFIISKVTPPAPPPPATPAKETAPKLYARVNTRGNTPQCSLMHSGAGLRVCLVLVVRSQPPNPNPLQVQRPVMRPMPIGGDFDADWQPTVIPPGLIQPMPAGGGNLMGPAHPLFDGRGGVGGRGMGGLGPFGGGGPFGRGGPGGMAPRFDPFGPLPGMGE